VDGVEVALLSVKRISDGSLTVKWEYRDRTHEPKRLGESFDGMGSSEAYTLVWHAYLADSRNKIKYPMAKDQRGTPVAGRHGPRKVVLVEPKQTMGTWAKFINVPQIFDFYPWSTAVRGRGNQRMTLLDGCRNT
jgi:hypothetical protein